jgi:hypothetical protein
MDEDAKAGDRNTGPHSTIIGPVAEVHARQPGSML